MKKVSFQRGGVDFKRAVTVERPFFYGHWTQDESRLETESHHRFRIVGQPRFLFGCITHFTLIR
jgi:hypothetical protein